MTRSVVTLLFLFISLSPVYSQFKEKSLKAVNGEHIGFNEFLPEDYRKTGERHPLIIFLHGIGERGDGKKDLSKAVSAGLPKFIRQGHKMRFQVNGKWESFVVLVPQLDSKYGYWRNFYTEEMIKYAKANLNIDPNRIFLTGMSLGGGGVGNLLLLHLKMPNPLQLLFPYVVPADFHLLQILLKATFPSGHFMLQMIKQFP